MRKLIWILAILAVLWAGWWWMLSRTIAQGAETFFANQRAQGWQARAEDTRQNGFPARVHTRFINLDLRDPQTGAAISAPETRLTLPAYWPGTVTLDLPAAQVGLSTPVKPQQGKFDDVQAHLHLNPGLDLQLDELRLQSGPWEIAARVGRPLRAENLFLRLKQDDTTDSVYHALFEMRGLAPSDMSREVLALPDDWPETFAVLNADAKVTFDTALDRHALNGTTPQPRHITLRQAEIAWGPVGIALTGNVAIDASGVPEGAFRLEVAQWETLLDLAERFEVLPAPQRQQAQTFFSALARFGGGDLQNLDLTLSFEDDVMSLGTIKLGPAPRFVIP